MRHNDVCLRLLPVLVAALTFPAGGCKRAGGAHRPPTGGPHGDVHLSTLDARPDFWFSPIDQTTAVGESPRIEVTVGRSGQPVGATLLGEIARSVSLRTWPGLVEVATTTEITDTPGTWGSEAFAHVVLVPKQPLADRWYAIYMSEQPAGVALSMHGRVLVVDKRVRVARFRVGSQPMLTAVQFHESADKPRVHLHFSEPVDLTAAHLRTLKLRLRQGGEAACTPLDQSGQKSRRIAMTCGKAKGWDVQELSVSPAVNARAAIASGDPADRVPIAQQRLLPCGPGCSFLPL